MTGEKKDIKILVATHKKTWIPKDDIYYPIQVGKALTDNDFGYLCDDNGENISIKNAEYCELTAVYWAWKNLHCDYIGLVHYGRMFSEKRINPFVKNKAKYVMKRDYLEKILENNCIILPKKRKYYIESLYYHYAHTHEEAHLLEVQKIISELCPDYLKAYECVMQRTWGHMFNMFVMRKKYFNQYCEWLFPILNLLEDRIDTSNMTDFDRRYIGRISECLLNVWIEKNNLKYAELNWIYLRRINYLEKCVSFLKAKFFHKKYKKSF